MDLDLSGFKFHNRFDIVATNVETGEKIKGKAENVVLNQFYKKMVGAGAANYNGINAIFVGSGNTPPTPEDTALESFIVRRTTNAGFNWDKSQITPGGTGVMVYSASIRLEANEFNGQFIREVGLGLNTSPYPLATRAILQDANGNPLEIEKTADPPMVVDIYATAFLTMPDKISGYHFLIGSSYPQFLNKLDLFYYMEHFRFYTRRYPVSWNDDPIPATFSTAVIGVMEADYVGDTNNMKRNYSFSAIQVGQQNIGGIREVRIGGESVGQILIPVPNDEITQPVIVKEVVGTGDGSTVGFSTKWGWIRNNGTLEVFINDIKQNDGFSIEYDKPNSMVVPHFLDYVYEYRPSTAIGNVQMYEYDTSLVDIKSVQYVGTIDLPLVFSDSLTGFPFTDISIPAGGTVDLSSELKSKKYIGTRTDRIAQARFYQTPEIIFDTPPPEGATIAVTYQPDCIAKDETKIINNITYSLGL